MVEGKVPRGKSRVIPDSRSMRCGIYRQAAEFAVTPVRTKMQRHSDFVQNQPFTTPNNRTKRDTSKMSLSLAATLSIACGNTSAHGEQKPTRASPQLPVSRKPLHPHLPDRTEGLLSPDILAMQHRVREGKHRGLDAHAVRHS